MDAEREPILEVTHIECEHCEKVLTLNEDRGWWLDATGSLVCSVDDRTIHSPVRVAVVRED